MAPVRERVAALLAPETAGAWSPRGYLDTLPPEPVAAPGRAQSAWQSGFGSALYGQVLQPVAGSSWLTSTFSHAPRRLHLEPGQTVADIGCGPGNLTVPLAETVGPDGLAVGVDISAPMLERAAAAAPPNLALIRGDATSVPLRTGCVDAACATAVVMLVPDPDAALAELVRVVAPGGRVLVVVPARPVGPVSTLARPAWDGFFAWAGARQITADQLADKLQALGCDRVHTDQQGMLLSASARTGPRT